MRYEYQYVEVGGSSPIIVNAGLNLNANLTGLTNGTTYEFSVRAVYDEGGVEVNGPYGNTETATPLSLEITAPTTTATPGNELVNLSWSTADLGGRTFNSYVILWKVDGSSSFISGEAITDLNTTTTIVSGLTNETTYEFSVRVTATNGDHSDYGIDTATPSATLGIEELSKDKISFYPNPVNDAFHIKLLDENINVKLFSVNGVLLKEVKNEKIIDISNFTSGIYILQIQIEGKIYSGKIIKD